MANVPVTVGVPLSVPVPLPLLRNVTPAGKAPLSVMLGVGDPLVFTVNVPAAPTWNVTAFALVNAGALFTVSVKLCVAFGLAPFCAVNVMANVPVTVGVPLSVPVPLPLSRNVTPAGKAPLSVMLGVGDPLVFTVNVPAAPAWNVTAFVLVIVGGWPTVSVKLCVAFGLTPFCAVNVMANVPDAVGVPLSVPVPLPLPRDVTPAGTGPLSVMLGVGNPVVFTVNVPKAPTWNVVEFALVIIILFTRKRWAAILPSTGLLPPPCPSVVVLDEASCLSCA